jgi:hypothetical protein
VASKEAYVPRVSVSPVTDRRLWTVDDFGRWANIDPHDVYRQIALGRVPGVVRFGRSIRIDPEVAIPALRGEAAMRHD